MSDSTFCFIFDTVTILISLAAMILSWFSARMNRQRSGVHQMAAQLTQFDLDHFEDMLVNGTHFSAALCRLIRKADPENRQRLALVYPEHVMACALFDLVAPRPHVAVRVM